MAKIKGTLEFAYFLLISIFCRATQAKFKFCQISEKLLIDPRWRIKIRFFSLTLGVFNIFTISLMHLIRIRKKLFSAKNFTKTLKMAAQNDINFSRHLGFL
jgi:hypothetical protein